MRKLKKITANKTQQCQQLKQPKHIH